MRRPPRESFRHDRPLTILAVFAVVLGFISTPAWPWFTSFLDGPARRVNCDLRGFLEPGSISAVRRSWHAAPHAVLLAHRPAVSALAGGSTDASQLTRADRPGSARAAHPQIFNVLRNRLLCRRTLRCHRHSLQYMVPHASATGSTVGLGRRGTTRRFLVLGLAWSTLARHTW